MIQMADPKESQLLLQTTDVLKRLRVEQKILSQAAEEVSKQLIKIEVLTVDRKEEIRAQSWREDDTDGDIMPAEVVEEEEEEEEMLRSACAMEFTAEQSAANDELEERPDAEPEDNSDAEDNSDREDNSNSRFGKVDYWNKRFADEEVYDWLVEFEHVAKDILPLLQISDRILIVGCGNSTFSRRLYDAGYTNIVNIDYSGVVIERMRELNKDVPGMEWQTMDMRMLDFLDKSFDVVIDKAAMDALVVDEGDVWDPNTEYLMGYRAAGVEFWQF
ncbi:S-adenosyl-L-methionine-dependent methyltransferase [Ochromonadaceae sp. CCMP2298]|nr:S-adenosyl-L-methionine-dependent methyltransferase [Ochromonadaceae sp. CCMP2298]